MKIEKYNIQENKWEILDWKLFAGFENGTLIPTNRPNEVIILGGKKTRNKSNSVWLYNLQEKSVLNMKPMHNPSILGKHSILDEHRTMVIGQNTDGKYFWEKYDFSEDTKSEHGTIKNFPLKIKKIKQFNFNQYNNVVKYQQMMAQDYINRNYAQKSVIFGTDLEPFQIEIDALNGNIQIVPIPTNLRINCFQSICRIDYNQLFFCGGITTELNKIFKSAYIYNLNTRIVTKLGKMSNIRYTFPSINCNGYVYVIGGREFGGDKTAIMSKTERLNLLTLKWEELPDLNVKRCTSNAFVYNNEVYVAGGYTNKVARTDVIEKFDENSFSWTKLEIKLATPVEASVHMIKNNMVYLMGGREKKGDCKAIQYFDLENLNRNAERQDNALRYSGCLNKMITVGGHFFIFGADGMKNMDIVNESQMVKISADEFKLTLV
jgi:hypothetical protein